MVSFAVAWQYHDAGILPFALLVFAAFHANSWHECRQLGLAVYRMRVPVIAALLAFAIYTNDQILEVLAKPYVGQSGRVEVLPVLSFVVTAMALWLWARFFSLFEPKPQDSAPKADGLETAEPAFEPSGAEGGASWRQMLSIGAIFAGLIALHVLVYSVLDKVIAGTTLYDITSIAGYIAKAITSISFVSWVYFTCIFNRHLPLTNNLPRTLKPLSYELKVRLILLRLFPVALPSLLGAATLYNVLPRIYLDWDGIDKLQMAFGAFAVLFGVGFLIDDLFVRSFRRQDASVRAKLGPSGDSVLGAVRRALKGAPDEPQPAVAHLLELILFSGLALVSFASRFRLGAVAAANLLVNVVLVLALVKARKRYQPDRTLWVSYFAKEPIPEKLAVWRREGYGGGRLENAPSEAANRSLRENLGPMEHRADLWGMIDLFGISIVLGAAVLLGAHHLWPGAAFSDNAYLLIAPAFLIFLPILPTLVYVILAILPAVFFIAPFVDVRSFSPPGQTLVVINVFIVASLGFFALLQLASRRRSLIALFFGAIALLSAFDLNDNHAIPREAQQKPVPAQNVTAAFYGWLEDHMQRWEAARPAGKAGNKHPVYIVAAQGGGAYAARHAALFLAKVQDEFPDFADHVFAISGVSGGSVGGAVFASLVRASVGRVRDMGWYSSAASSLLNKDLLTPAIAGTLFHDTIARVIPCLDDRPQLCTTLNLDRARDFELALEGAWDDLARDYRLEKGDNPFRQRLTQLWTPESSVPALLLNTTEVETGERVVLAPFLLQPDIHTLASLIDRDKGLDIKLSTASGLSARFPGLMAPGWYRIKDSKEEDAFKRRLVDGGYFENSGVATAFDLLKSLEKSLSGEYLQRIELILISVKLGGSENPEVEPPHGFHEIMTPLRTLNNTRAARGRLAVDQASLALNNTVCRDKRNSDPQDPADPTCFYAKRMRISVLVSDSRQPLPLGWLLSEASKDRIKKSIGSPSECPGNESRLDDVTIRNSCLIWQIGKDLSDGIARPVGTVAEPWTAAIQQAP